ncbi:MAG: class I SAM-dependent methyltransferase [Anaerolineales bacterium]|nr:class I SAM-dependent methyltransferase [Anaerolineales bacterium]
MNNLPNPDLIYDLFGGIFKPQFIRIALQLDVFTPLAENPSTAEQIAQACNCDSTGIKFLLDNLCAAQLLTLEDNRYSLTLDAATFLARGRKAYAGDMILDYTNPAMYASIAQSIRAGQPHWLNENFVQDAWLESYSQTRIPKSLEMWQAVGVSTDKPLRLLDLACGCAIKSFALAQAFPNVRVTCLDSADVLDVARDLAERIGLTSRVTFLPADLLTADLNASFFDLALVGQITHYLTPDQNRALFRRIHAALTDGGSLVIDCPMSQETPTESSAFLSIFLWANSGGTAHSFETYREWLKEAGFRSVAQLSERWVSAVT